MTGRGPTFKWEIKTNWDGYFLLDSSLPRFLTSSLPLGSKQSSNLICSLIGSVPFIPIIALDSVLSSFMSSTWLTAVMNKKHFRHQPMGPSHQLFSLATGLVLCVCQPASLAHPMKQALNWWVQEVSSREEHHLEMACEPNHHIYPRGTSKPAPRKPGLPKSWFLLVAEQFEGHIYLVVNNTGHHCYAPCVGTL